MKYVDAIISLLVVIVSLTILAVIVGKRSSTTNVIRDFSAFYQKAVSVFVSPLKR